MQVNEVMSGPVRALRTSGTVWLGLFVLGIGFGVLCRNVGLDWWVVPLTSVVIFAGSVEFILVGMLAATAPLGAIALVTLLVNSRHVMYGLSFPLHRVTGRMRKLYSVYALCDEAFVLCTSPAARTWSSSQIVWTQIGMQASWAVGGLIGAVAGSVVLGGLVGLGFVLTALFLILAVDAVAESRDVGTIVAAVASAVVAHLIAPGAMLIVAMSMFTAAMLIRYALVDRRAPTTPVPDTGVRTEPEKVLEHA